jgi:RNA polymerase sigma-70 factor, ECF subfamily
MTRPSMQLRGTALVPRFPTRSEPHTEPNARDDRTEEAALIAAAQANPFAFVPLYQRYFKPVYRYCYIRLNGREAAEDATSQVFVKALANLRRFQGGSFVAWLFRITRNVVIDAYRARSPTVSFEAVADKVDPAPTVEDQVERQVERQALQAALAALPEPQRTVVELTLAGWSGEEIGQALNKTPDAIKMDRYRALKQLREFIAQANSAEVCGDR